MKTLSFALFATAIAFTACKKADDKAAKPATKPAETAAPATTGSAPAPTPAPTPTPAAAVGDIDLTPGGPAWAGYSIKAPAGSMVSENGAGGLTVLSKAFGIEINPELQAQARKDGAKFGAESAKGKITFTIDKADEFAYITETPGADGASFKGYGFGITVTVGDKKLACTGVLDSEEQVALAKAACNSLSKK